MNFKKYFEQQNISLTNKERISIKIGGLITAARLYSSLSQKELAEKIGTKQPSIARAEKGEVIAGIEFLDKIAKAIDTELIIKFGFMEQDNGIGNCEIKRSYDILSPYPQQYNIVAK